MPKHSVVRWPGRLGLLLLLGLGTPACTLGTSFDRDTIDSDGDEVADPIDNCPATPNPEQEDLDGDRLGDACDDDRDGDGLDDDGDN